MKISIIIPTLNEEKVLRGILENLRPAAEAGLVELVISDGHSTDSTVEIARRYTEKVIIYEGAKRQTIAMARNMGAAQAEGEIFLFMDADVYVPDPIHFFTKAITYFEKDEHLVGLTAFLNVHKKDETFLDYIIFSSANLFYILQNNVFKSGAAPGEFQMVRASAFRSISGYNEALVVAEDIDFFRRLSKVGRTYAASTLRVYHTGRRAHTIGWHRLLFLWWSNFFFVTFFHRSVAEEWTEIR